MSSEALVASESSSRFGNISGVALVGSRVEGPARESGLLDSLFSEWIALDVNHLSDPVSLGTIARALEASTAERVLVLRAAAGEPVPSFDVLLALACWPEADAVIFDSGHPGSTTFCALLQRARCLEEAQASGSEHGEPSLDAFFSALDAVRVSNADLGLGEPGTRAQHSESSGSC